MSLANALANEFTYRVRQRGQNYFLGGTVEITGGSPLTLEAWVDGTVRYQVWITCSGPTVIASCTCPHFVGQIKPCKHLWAALLAGVAEGHLDGMSAAALSEAYIDITIAPDDLNKVPELPGTMVPRQPTADGPGFGTPHQTLQQPLEQSEPWQVWLARLGPASPFPPASRGAVRLNDGELIYAVDINATGSVGNLVIELLSRKRKKNGDWSKPKAARLDAGVVDTLSNPSDREILGLVEGAQAWYGYASRFSSPFSHAGRTQILLSEVLEQQLVPRIFGSNRGFLRQAGGTIQPIRWEDGPAWEFWVEVRHDPERAQYELGGSFRRAGVRLDVVVPPVVTRDHLVWRGAGEGGGGGEAGAGGRHWYTIGRVDVGDAFDWMVRLRHDGPLAVPVENVDQVLAAIAHRRPRWLDMPDELKIDDAVGVPRACLHVARAEPYGPRRLTATLAFDYDGYAMEADSEARGVFLQAERRFIRRDTDAETRARTRLDDVGFRLVRDYRSYNAAAWLLEIPAGRLPQAVATLLRDGWRVDAEGVRYRQPGTSTFSVRSGIDWFELHAEVDFEGVSATLPELLDAVKRGDGMVTLGDGSKGLLPESWLEQHGLLVATGIATGDHIRFSRPQAALLDALLAAQPTVSIDATFEAARAELASFDGIGPAEPPPSFTGQLRDYQRDGLGWLHFLEHFGIGGCLADDMGLGKTVMALAALECRRLSQADEPVDARRPSLVVVPRSLVFNWMSEARRFTPALRMLEYLGPGRAARRRKMADHDVLITTYGTLRRDIATLKDVQFDYVILDEAQAVKNAASVGAKAVRLLQARHRLALSGTPVENHLGELWSLFEFLNPGLLGANASFRRASQGAGAETNSALDTLARGLRPFILRRTKAQVAPELPPKTEQTLHCELDREERKLYNELRDHYRASLLARVDKNGLARSKIHVLEALLRLRQAACHPGLIDKTRAEQSSAKLDVLYEQLSDVLAEGHKALVFSQFTSLLSILRTRLDRDQVTYEYLDGRTRNRAERITRFQEDPNTRLFLISLQAGGLGLNLTAAEYVFLLDPWWNPAVEAQAIDRTHRIGQTRPVFAYRLISRDTVEERVLELQGAKRDLADAIVRADANLIRSLRKEDLELLLS